MFVTLKRDLGDFLGGPVGKTPCYQCKGPGFDPSSWTRSHMNATSKTQHSQNELTLKKRERPNDFPVVK